MHREPADALLRPAVPADLKAVAEIYAHYVERTVITFDEQPLTVADWEQRLARLTGDGLPFLVAERAGEIAGYGYAAPWRPKPAYRYAAEDTLYLAPDRTGRGLGRALLEELVLRSEQAGLRQLIAVVSDLPPEPGGPADPAGTAASLALHEKCGFIRAGRLDAVGYKHGRWVDTVLLRRRLGGPGTGAAAAR